MTEHIAGGHTILFAPTVPAGVGLDGVIGSVEKVNRVDIVVGADGAVIKDRHGNAHAVLAKLAADIDTQPASEELDWGEVGKAACLYAISQFGTWWGMRRIARKAGAPDWAVKVAGRLTLLIAAPQSREGSGFDKEMMERVSREGPPALAALIAERRRKWREER